MSNERDVLRPVQITGHQESWRGFFHRFTEHDSQAKAIIEDDQGRIALVDAYKVQFLDRE